MCIMTIQHHCVTLGICQALCYSEIKKKKKKRKKKTLLKSPFQLCAHSVCTVDAAIITWQVAEQGSKGPTGSQVISPHIYVQFRSITVKHCHDVWFHLPQQCRKIYIRIRFHNTPVCLCISNVASFTLPCYVTTPCAGSVQVLVISKGDIFKY